MSSSSIDNKEIRKFGIIAFLFFGCLGVLGLWRQKPLPAYIFGFLSFLGIVFIIFPAPLRPIYNIWLKIAHFLGRIVTVLILTLAYYFVITPFALVKRMISGRPLPTKPDEGISSYWVTRSEPAQPKDRFIKRY